MMLRSLDEFYLATVSNGCIASLSSGACRFSITNIWQSSTIWVQKEFYCS